jgi:hypothetical protein
VEAVPPAPAPEPAPALARTVVVGRHRAEPDRRSGHGEQEAGFRTDGYTALEEIFASQEEARLARRFPEQRHRGSHGSHGSQTA